MTGKMSCTHERWHFHPTTIKTKAESILLIWIAALFGMFLVVVPVSAQSSTQDGKLHIHVSPKQAYVFVDGKAIRDGSQTIELTTGKHSVAVENYGYAPQSQDVEITAGHTTNLDVALEASGAKVSGPFGDIEFKGHPRAAVLLNGNTPAYFVGHVDEFDWDWIWHQRLLVHPGTFMVTVTQEGNTVWSGPVTVKAGQKVVVDLNRNGETKTVNWPEGNTMGPQARFHAGVASATVPIAPVTAQLSAQASQVGCGQSTNLNWNSADAVAVSITDLGNVGASGERSVSPTKTTNYQLIAKGPGGDAMQTATVNVNSQPTATLSLSQPEAHFHQIGDKIVQDDTVTLNWTTTNADKVTIAPLGAEATSGSQTVEAKPKRTGIGPVNESFGYTLVSSNACGGTAKQTAVLHIVGSIDPPPPVTLASLFYPTNYPNSKHPRIGLVATEKATLSEIAIRFMNHEQYDGNASLMIVGHADVRGSKKYNLALSERRAELVKGFLVSKGVPANKVQTRAIGKEEQLNEKKVVELQSEDAQKPEKWMMYHGKATWLAYNRRVDVLLEPSGQHSTEAYPNDASDARILWQRPEPSLRAVELAGKTSAGTKEAQVMGPGH